MLSTRPERYRYIHDDSGSQWWPLGSRQGAEEDDTEAQLIGLLRVTHVMDLLRKGTG